MSESLIASASALHARGRDVPPGSAAARMRQALTQRRVVDHGRRTTTACRRGA
ncbi:hypothetical protein [Haloactinomyces albus]|uniref:Uncharacterized protein n=1 Tax=Haloactinomyces albus TaxID=1352928 RepID=A0AAE4CLW3_9ACTN|nr:hypothetical protein [Haloactinomyces albus]MDR7302650.1 hypothetical protein [Haloactinomyces albus]